MTQDATITQIAPSQPRIPGLAFQCLGSLAAQVAALPARVSVKPAHADSDTPAPYSVINVSTLSTASGTTTKSKFIFNRLPALSWQFSSLSCMPRRHLVLIMCLYTVLLILAKRARARILDRWQEYAYTHLKSIGWKKYGASDNTVKRATVFIQYQNAQSNHC